MRSRSYSRSNWTAQLCSVISIQEVKHFQEEKRGHDIDKTGADANAKCYSVTQAIG